MGYTKQVYKYAQEELARRRDAARERNAARYDEIAKKIPRIPLIQEEMAETARKVTKTVILSPQNAKNEIGALRDKSLALQKERASLLLSSGYPEDYLKEQAACEICGGSGWRESEMCRCFSEILKQRAYAELSEVSQLKNCSFENFSVEMYPETPADGGASPRAHMAGIHSFCKRYAQGFTKTSESLLMLGHTGLGKTHMSLAVAGVVTGLGYGVLYTPVQKLTDKLETLKFSYSQEAKEQYSRDMESVLSCDLLVLDDLGSEFITQFSSSILYNIVNSRLVETRPTIISTNLEPLEIEQKYAPRMLSRLMGGCRALEFTGKDIRFLKKMRH